MSSESFKRAVLALIQIEGGLHEDPTDPGGLTNFGIALNEHPDMSADQIEHMTIGQAIDFYEAHYWQPIRGNELPDAIAYCLFDAAVDQGIVPAVKMLQRTLVIPADGIVGPQTVDVCARADLHDVVTGFSAERILRYSANPNWSGNGRGWARRVMQNCLDSGA